MYNTRKKNRIYKRVERSLDRPDICSDCGAVDVVIHGHHEDYSKPLEVIWLCVSCHMKLHERKRNAITKEERRKLRREKLEAAGFILVDTDKIEPEYKPWLVPESLIKPPDKNKIGWWMEPAPPGVFKLL